MTSATFRMSLALCIAVFVASSVSADARQVKTCEFSKKMLLKNPSCSQDLKDAANKIDCLSDTTGVTQMNQLQEKCVPQAQAKAGDTSAKIADLKKAEPTDERLIELKKKLEAKKMEREAAKANK